MNREQENEVIHRWQNHQSLRSIALELNLSRYQVSSVIKSHVQSRDADVQAQADANADAPPASLGPVPTRRASKLDPFNEEITRLLERYPRITVTRVFEELTRSGYRGG
ncbi:hypothetical protein Q31b_23530 [Novipirellula aureliae]|uniref:Uncharacterized protein n=1 Tax=Novipirellula aureliae TaxID=2527966 RepID=A0A5C6E3N9_9BACT|nr:hypothetical protein [Novipirellula aureliae]TWU43315.1 hypothetical protein Q31b_23530 [Novipirellula aureliae]